MSLRRSLLRSRTCRFSFTFSKSSKEFRVPDAFDTRSALSVAGVKIDAEDLHGDLWSTMLPEILGDIILRVEAGEDRWPVRRDVVSCACVCKRWRNITKEIVQSPLRCGKITFPSCLKQPGPEDCLLQCLIQRDKKNGTFFLYLAHAPASFSEMGKFLLAARRFKHGARTEYLISLSRDDISEGSNAYVGKLSSDLFGTNFKIYDSRPSNCTDMPSTYRGMPPSCRTSRRRLLSKQISPEISDNGNFETGHISYKLNLLKSKGPRRIVCSLKEACGVELLDNNNGLELRNKAPRWHEHMQCWCLNFHGRVTVASVKNFQLAAVTMEGGVVKGDDEDSLVLQFGKVEDDVFTMDFKHPLSAFQAFAICLTSFGTKLACE